MNAIALLKEAVLALRRLAIRRHGAFDCCHLCGAVDEHTPDCLIYRIERFLEEHA